MWSIMDSDAPLVADEVYAQLFKYSEPDPTQAAHALHHAVKKLIEDSIGTKSFWNGYHSFTLGFEYVAPD